jgi:hypothetical protein
LISPQDIGGRLQKIENFAKDFPIDIGGEWIHVHPSILDVLAYDNATEQLNIIQYLSEYEEWDGLQWETVAFNSTDYKFVGYTWFDFFNDYLAPFVEDNLYLNCQVTAIDWSSSSSKNSVQCADGRQWLADHVIVTASIKILQDGDIQFTPPLPTDTRDAIEAIQMMSGLKVFLKFSARFYKDAFEFATDYQGILIGQRYYYDATYGQPTDENVLGLFAVGDAADPFVVLSDNEIVTLILDQLDSVFGGQASATFIEAYVKNWNEVPFIRGAYSRLPDIDALLWPIPTLRNSTKTRNRIFFAGEAIPVDWEWGFAHGAALSGRFAAERILALLEADGVMPAEDAPTILPTSATFSPTLIPKTIAPTSLPTTVVPTSLPTTVVPTSLSTTVVPTSLPTSAPSDASTSTAAPSKASDASTMSGEMPLDVSDGETETNDTLTSNTMDSTIDGNDSTRNSTDETATPSEMPASGSFCTYNNAGHLLSLVSIALHLYSFSCL